MVALPTGGDGVNVAVSGAIVFGVICSPDGFERRTRLRADFALARRKFLPALEWRFVVGRVGGCAAAVLRALGCGSVGTAGACARLQREQLIHGDLELLAHARDCEGKSSVAPKTLEWYIRAVRLFPSAAWVGKIDDDSAVNFRRLRRDVLDMEAIGRQCGSAELHAYYGTLRWRLWSLAWRSGCGSVFAASTVGRQARRPLAWLDEETLPSGRCNSTVLPLGPFPYADGALHLVSYPLARAVFAPGGSARSTLDDFMGADGRQTWGRSDGRLWTQEDVGIGFLVYAESLVRRLPTFYFSLSTAHYKRIGGEVYRDVRRKGFVGAFKRAVVAHKIFDAMVHNYTMRAFDQFPLDVDAFYCQSCTAAWGWAEVDRLSPDTLLERGAPAPTRVASSEQAFGCCEKSALNRGMMERIDGVDQMARGCFRDWETQVTSLAKHHQRMPMGGGGLAR